MRSGRQLRDGEAFRDDPGMEPVVLDWRGNAGATGHDGDRVTAGRQRPVVRGGLDPLGKPRDHRDARGAKVTVFGTRDY